MPEALAELAGAGAYAMCVITAAILWSAIVDAIRSRSRGR